MTQTVLLPTHSCFDDAMEFLNLAVLEDKEGACQHLRLVHAICLMPEGPKTDDPFAHGWIEVDRKFVVQAAMLDGDKIFFACARREFYAKLRVQLSTVYTVQEAVAKNWEQGTFGPWVDAYRALCRGGERLTFKVDGLPC